MFFADLASIQGVLWKQVLLAIVVGLFVPLMVGNLAMVIPIIGVIIPLYVIFSLITYDSQSGWEGYRLSLPLSRNQSVFGRYLLIFVIAIASVLIGLIIQGALVLSVPLLSMLPLGSPYFDSLAELDAYILIFLSLTPLIIVLIMAGIMFPFAYRLGMTTAVRWIPIAFMLIVFGLGAVIELTNTNVVIDFITWVIIPENSALAAAISLGICGVIYLGSAALSAKLYHAREL
jgi:ABC-2 type transport system permease protein